MTPTNHDTLPFHVTQDRSVIQLFCLKSTVAVILADFKALEIIWRIMQKILLVMDLGQEPDVALELVTLSDGGLAGGQVSPGREQHPLHQLEVSLEPGQRLLRLTSDRFVHRLRVHVMAYLLTITLSK